MQHPARYAVTFGLQGCYMPDNHMDAMEFATRSELVKFIKWELADLEWPAYLLKEVRIQRLWRKIQFAKSASSCHFSIAYKGNELAFYGLTEDEFNAMQEESM